MSAPGALAQALRFCVVGLLNTAACVAIVALLRLWPGVSVWLASAIGYAVATAQSYLLNRNWTFAGQDAPVAAQFGRFILVNVVMGLLFSGLNARLALAFPIALSTLLTMAVIVPTSFAAMRFLVFGRR